MIQIDYATKDLPVTKVTACCTMNGAHTVAARVSMSGRHIWLGNGAADGVVPVRNSDFVLISPDDAECFGKALINLAQQLRAGINGELYI